MAKKKATGGSLVYIVLDKSGSMAAIQGATIDGINKFVLATAQVDPEARFSLQLFDTKVSKVYDNVPISSVSEVDAKTYSPDGFTALLDAVGRAIHDIDELPERPAKIVVAVMTDGQENSSREYTREAVKKLVSKREKDGWQFLFLGANLDAFAEAGAIGMRHAARTSATWQPTAAGAQALYASVASSTGSYLRGSASSVTLTQDNYDDMIAVAASPGGDVWAGLIDNDNQTKTDAGTTPPVGTVVDAKKVGAKRPR